MVERNLDWARSRAGTKFFILYVFLKVGVVLKRGHVTGFNRGHFKLCLFFI